MSQHTPCVHKEAGEGALRAPFEPHAAGRALTALPVVVRLVADHLNAVVVARANGRVRLLAVVVDAVVASASVSARVPPKARRAEREAGLTKGAAPVRRQCVDRTLAHMVVWKAIRYPRPSKSKHTRSESSLSASLTLRWRVQ